MRTSAKITGGLALLTIGYALGASHILSPEMLLAQGKSKSTAGGDAQAAQPLSDETKTKIKAAADALKAAMEALQAEGKYEASAIKSVNSFAVLSGGGNSLSDLTSSGNVDPETFAALYAGLATDQVVVDLGRDAEGKLTYKNRVIRMHPVSLIRGAYARRADITGEDLLPVAVDDSTKAKAKKSEPKEEESTEE
ncbi:MAG: hypothetical protein ACM3U2_24650 [Deltaproteobacteria bacterium]